jgi:hypothetical protein
MQPDNPVYRVTFVVDDREHVEMVDAPGALAAMEYTSFVHQISEEMLRTEIWE